MLPRLLPLALAGAAAIASAQDSVYVPDNRADQGYCTSMPFGSFSEYPVARNQKYQTLVPWDHLKGLTRPFVEEIGFASCYSGAHRFATIKVRMSQIPASKLSTQFGKNLGASAVTVLESSDYYWYHEKNTWSRLGLQRGFQLIPGQHLVIDIEVTGAVFLNPDLSESTNAIGSFREGGAAMPRLYALNWTTAPPPTGKLSRFGLKIEVSSRLSALGSFGIGCPGHAKVAPAVRLTGTAAPGGTVIANLSLGAATSPTLLVIGFDNRPPYPLPLGFGGCRLYQPVTIALASASDAAGKLAIPLPLPVSSTLSNQRFYTQFFQVELNTRPLGLRASNYGRALIR